jgi:hypothetical protein
MRFLFLLLLSTSVLAQPKTVKLGTYRLQIGADGAVMNLRETTTRQVWSGTLQTELDGLTGRVVSTKTTDNKLVITKEWASDTRRCQTTETFAVDTGALRWELTVTSQTNKPWSTAIRTVARMPQASHFWTSWGDPRPDVSEAILSTGDTRALLDGNARMRATGQRPVTEWVDPLVPQPIGNRQIWYGAPIYGSERTDGSNIPAIYYGPWSIRNYCSVPLLTLIDSTRRQGLSLGISPVDLGVEGLVRTQTGGQVSFSRYNNRLSPGKPVTFTTYLYTHAPDWRPALGAYAQQFAAYFDPVVPQVQDFGGTSAYSWKTTDLDTAKLHRMAFKTNWDATFPFLYMGQFLPPVPDSVGWLTWRGLPASFPIIDRYYARMQRNGFHVLSYFNVTEYGNYVVAKKDYVPRKGDFREVWWNTNKFLQDVVEPAVIYQPGDTTYSNYIYTYERTIVMDPATPVYTKFMAEQARRHLTRLPHFEGIAIDRMDWTRHYNPRADDGRTWFEGKPYRSLHTSWNVVLDTLHRILHPAGKVIFINNHVKRLEDTRYADGIFDEFGYAAASINANALLCLNKPLLGWCSNREQIFPDGDGYMQRHLHLGMFPMAPFPDNDHGLLPDPQTDQLFLDYGALQGPARQTLAPHRRTRTAY